ncbi:MAG TPA: nuclear transport factor 2 family protein [Chloroflexota bacterium]
MTASHDVADASARFYAAVNQLQKGDPEPMFALWSHRADVLNAGPQGGRQQGWEEVRAYFANAARLAGANPGAVSATVSDAIITMVGDIAYVYGTEEVQVTGDGQVRRFTARATNIYRREAGGWKLVYRHADAPPSTR